MSRLIGGVRLYDEYFKGEDPCTDEERELLITSESTKHGEDGSAAAGYKTWAALYHFSPVRTNLLAWYPIKKTDRVLELGSGCGALSGLLADRAASVTCIDPSLTRCLINAHRHRECDNIDILAGVLEDLEEQLSESYDLIILADGLFGDAECSTDSALTRLRSLVKRLKKNTAGEGGRLLLATENRLGLRYFAGCREDRTGRFFAGIEGGPGCYSRQGLTRLLDEAGLPGQVFYYPYPDHRFPLSVYSDGYLPKKGELANNRVNYDRDRLELFDETRAWDAVIEDGLFPLFSNSYLIEAREA